MSQKKIPLKTQSSFQILDDNSSNDFFSIISQLILVNKEKLQTINKIWKSIKNQKINQLFEYMNEKNNLKTNVKDIITKKYQELNAGNVETILRIWFFLYFYEKKEISTNSKNEKDKNSENCNKNNGFVEFLQEISQIIEKNIYLVEIERCEEINNNDYEKNVIIYSQKKENKYYLKEDIDDSFIRKFKKIDDIKRVCSKCHKLVEKNSDSESILYKKCNHFFCKNCMKDNYNKEKFCEFCVEVFNQELLLCHFCRISYYDSYLKKCKKCKMFSCRNCLMKKVNDKKKICCPQPLCENE